MEDEKKEEKVKDEKSFLDSLIGKLNNGTIDRRKFLTLAGATGLTVLSATQLKAAGGGGGGMGGNCLSCHNQAPPSFVVDPNTKALMDRAKSLGIDLVWDRGAPCNYSHKSKMSGGGDGKAGNAGLCCFRCQMGPCTLGAATGATRGGCGATADIIVARDLVRRVAGGAASHAEHARAAAKTLKGVGDGTCPDYTITDPDKLAAIYAGLKCTPADGANMALAVANKTLEDLGKDEGQPAWLNYKANAERIATWRGLGILPTGAGAEISEAMHRTTMGVDGDMGHLATDALKLGLVDGYCGLHPATNIQDVLFGEPMAGPSTVGLSVIEAGKTNIVIHGHEAILAEKIVEVASEYPDVNVVGICCTGNEMLMRKGVRAAGSMVQAELAIITGAVEAMVVDVQCIIPNVQRVAEKFHTKIITTNPHAMITGATHIAFTPETALYTARQIVEIARANRAARGVKLPVQIPTDLPKQVMKGFSVKQIVEALSADALKAIDPDPIRLLIRIIRGDFYNLGLWIRGIVGIVGCVTPRDTYGYRHATLTKRLLAQNILVVGTGCWAHVAGQYGYLTPRDKQGLIDFGVGANLAAVLDTVATAALGPGGKLPPCWHMGSCVDNCRIEDVLNAVAGKASEIYNTTVPINYLPVAASAPEFITEKAVSIGTWAVDLGLFTHIGGQPYVSGSAELVKLLTGQAVELPGLGLSLPEGVKTLTGGKFYVEKNPETAATTIINHINSKRSALNQIDSQWRTT